MSALKYYDSVSGTWKYLMQGPKGDQGDPGPAGSGSGDMLKSTYDPASKNAQLAADSEVVHLAGGETITGAKLFNASSSTGAITTLDITIQPNPGRSTSASIFLDSTAGQIFEFFVNNGGSFGVYDGTNSKQPFTINPNTPNSALVLDPSGNSMSQALNMNAHKITSVTDPTSAQDVATKNYVDGASTTGNAATATKLTTARTVQTNLAVTTSASFDGSANVTPGVTGTLPVANGGTGQSSTSITAKSFFASPNGSAGSPTFRAIVASDIPTLNQNTTGSAATLTTPRTINGVSFNGSANITITPRVNTTTSSATPAINTDTTDMFTITALAANITSMTTSLTGTPVNGQKLLIRFKDNGTARTITWGTSFVSSGVATLLATTVAGKTHMVGLIYDSTAAKWVCQAVDATGY